MILDTVIYSEAVAYLATLPDNSIDAVITDPPYNLTELDFEKIIDWPNYWRQVNRVMRTKNSPIVMFSQQPFTTELIMSNRKQWRYELIWEKTMPVGYLDAKRRPLRCHENIQVFAAARANYFPLMAEAETARARSVKKEDVRSAHYHAHRNGVWTDNGTRYPRSVLTYAQRNTSFEHTHTNHPTEKPLPLMNYLIELFTREGDVVLDCFAGSGTTLIAARDYDRHYLGCDDDRQWVAAAEKRLKDTDPYQNRTLASGVVQLSMWGAS